MCNLTLKQCLVLYLTSCIDKLLCSNPVTYLVQQVVQLVDQVCSCEILYFYKNKLSSEEQVLLVDPKLDIAKPQGVVKNNLNTPLIHTFGCPLIITDNGFSLLIFNQSQSGQSWCPRYSLVHKT